METLQYLALFLVFLLISYRLLANKRQCKNLPPSPPRLPIIGHFHLLTKPIHLAINDLLERYGPILFLYLGSRPVLVLSSQSAIEECFTKNDIIFTNRPSVLSVKFISYNNNVLGSAPYGDHWRSTRRLSNFEIFSLSRIQMSSSIREDELRRLMRQMMRGYNGEFRKVELKSLILKLAYNMIIRMIGVKGFFDEEEMVDPEKSKDRLEDLKNTFTVGNVLALGDFFPFLSWVDKWFAEKRLLKLHRKRDKLMQGFIDERRRARSTAAARMEEDGDKMMKRSLIDALLSLEENQPEDQQHTDDMIKGIVLILIMAGTHSTATTAEWAMSLILNHPEVLKKARDEIDSNVGHGRLLTESDVVKLPYLHCIIDETLRVCNAAPFLPARESSKDCTIAGFHIPRGTMLLVNLLDLHKDPSQWSEATKFKPERFEGARTQREKEEGFKWLPFGAGRRRCPGEALAMRTLGFMLGTFIQCFDWDRIGGEMVDMSVQIEILSMAKIKPLEAMYRPRKPLLDVLSQL